MVKNGTGIWTISSESVLANAKSLKIVDGAVKLNKAAATTSMTSPTITYVQDAGELRGLGYVYGVNVLAGGTLRAGANAAISQTNNTGIITLARNLNVEEGGNIYVNKTKTDPEYVNPRTGTITQNWAFFKVGGNAIINGTVNVTYKSTWTPKVGEFVKVLECAGTISGNSTFNLQELPAGMQWDTSKFLAEGLIYVDKATGINEIGFDGGFFKADVYTLGGFKITSLQTSQATLMKDLKACGLAAGTYIIRTPKGGKKVILK